MRNTILRITISALAGALIAFLMLSMSSCASNTPFTSGLKTQYGIGEKTMRKIQFYTSQEIVLTQYGGESQLHTIDGKILVNNTSRQNRIVIPKNTPCTIERVIDETKVIVAFEYGDERVLIFGVNAIGTYSLLANKWQGKDGVVEYGNATYKTANNSGMATLNVKLKRLNQYRNRERKVSGRRI